jgi:Kef-type K+ transport system membrane component KefB
VTGAAFALAAAGDAGVHATEQLLFHTLLQLCVIVIAARAAGAMAVRLGQAAVVGEIIVGILLGPSLFGAVAPELFASVFRSSSPLPMTIMSQVGLLFLMFQIGLEFDFSHLTEKPNRRAVIAVATAGLVVPFALGLLWAVMAPDAYVATNNRLGFTLFVATAFSITALPILGRIMMEFRLTREAVGVIAISAAAIIDVIGWLLLALVTMLTTSAWSGAAFGLQVLGVVAFGLASWWIVRPLLERLAESQLRRAAPGELPPTLLGLLIAVIFAGGMATYKLGIFAIFGGFMMGVLLHRQVDFVARWNDRVGGFVNVFFLPIFFTFTGLRTDIGSLSGGSAWGWCGLLIALATVGKYGACWWAARWAGQGRVEAKMIGIMMNTRALMELIIINVGFELGVIGREVFTMLVLMAIFSTVITAPFLRRWIPQATSLGARGSRFAA